MFTRLTHCRYLAMPRIAMCLLALIPALAAPTRADEPNSPTGILRLEGDGVKSLVLVNAGGRKITVEPFNHRVTLPPSTYTVNQISLTTGSACLAPAGLTFNIAAGSSTSIKVGGPLTPRIDATRRGADLNLSYYLRDIGGYRYSAPLSTARPPAFIVTKGDKVVGAGQFEYG